MSAEQQEIITPLAMAMRIAMRPDVSFAVSHLIVAAGDLREVRDIANGKEIALQRFGVSAPWAVVAEQAAIAHRGVDSTLEALVCAMTREGERWEGDSEVWLKTFVGVFLDAVASTRPGEWEEQDR